MNPVLSDLGNTVKWPGVYRKLSTLRRDWQVAKLLRGYLDETTKSQRTLMPEGLEAQSDEAVELIRKGLAPLRPGVDYHSACPGVHFFGHVQASLPEGLSPQEEVEEAIRGWTQSVRARTKKAYHLLFSVDPRIVLGLASRGIPADSLLLAAARNAIEEYASRFYGPGTLGGAAGVHFDRFHPHVHMLLHPLTSRGHGINLSSLAPAVVNGRPTRIDYQGALHSGFHRQALRIRDLLLPRDAPPFDPEVARQWVLLRELQPTAAPAEVASLQADPDWLAKHRDTLAQRRSVFLQLRLTPEVRVRLSQTQAQLGATLAARQQRRESLRALAQRILSDQAASPARPVLPRYGVDIAAEAEGQSLAYLAGHTAQEMCKPWEHIPALAAKRRAISRDPRGVAACSQRQREDAVRKEAASFAGFVAALRQRRSTFSALREATRSIARGVLNILGAVRRKLSFHLSGPTNSTRVLPTPTELADRRTELLQETEEALREHYRPLNLSTETGVSLSPHRSSRPSQPREPVTSPPLASTPTSAASHRGIGSLTPERRAQAQAIVQSLLERLEREAPVPTPDR